MAYLYLGEYCGTVFTCMFTVGGPRMLWTLGPSGVGSWAPLYTLLHPASRTV